MTRRICDDLSFVFFHDLYFDRNYYLFYCILTPLFGQLCSALMEYHLLYFYLDTLFIIFNCRVLLLDKVLWEDGWPVVGVPSDTPQIAPYLP